MKIEYVKDDLFLILKYKELVNYELNLSKNIKLRNYIFYIFLLKLIYLEI